jgi:ComF family protein
LQGHLCQENGAGITEAVFSSSEDRNRASQAKAAGAGPSIASRTGKAAVGPHCNNPHWFVPAWVGASAESLFAVLFPSDCRICGLPLFKISRLPVCQECLDAIRPISGSVCTICGERIFSPYALSSSGGEPRCGLCRRIEPAFVRATAYGSYESGLRELIQLLKYGGVRPAANVLGRMLAEAIEKLEPELPSDLVAVIPVPLHSAKLRQRGFNQAELIARAAVTSHPSRNRYRLCASVLERKRDTTSQTGLTTHQRRENLRGAFGVLHPEAVKGFEVLVVDDVYTTGATVSECARVLRRAGATKVWVATVARTLKISAQQVEIEPGYRGGVEEDEFSRASNVREVPLAHAAGR